MTNLTILNNHEKQEILNKLQKQFGISELPGILLKIGQERIFLFQGSLNEKQIKELEYNRTNIERVGIYFGKQQGNEIRLSIDGVHLLKDQISKNTFELNKEQVNTWMHGSELNLKPGKKGFVIMTNKEDFLGTGKASEEKITNFIPKSRRLKFKDHQ
ncbi:MAG: hypothetical protein ABIH59_03080 [archaeon]